jgi:O-antigen ligase
VESGKGNRDDQETDWANADHRLIDRNRAAVHRRSHPGGRTMPIGNVRTIGQRTRRTPLWSSRSAFFTDAGIFILGAAGAFGANFVGSVPGDEILLLPLLPLLILAKGGRALNRRYLWFYILTGAWLLGTLLADVYAGSPTETRLKGTARVVFFMFDFTALAILINDKTRRLIIFTVSIAFVMLYGSWDFHGNFYEQWKFGLAQALAIVALLVSSYFYARRRFLICLLISIGLGGLNLIYGFRSQLAVHFVSAVLVLPLMDQAQKGRKSSRAAQNRWRSIVLLVLAGGAAYAANAAIKYAAKSGFFDESTQAKFETQAQGDLGVLFGGRPETLVAIQAIRDSPIIGHGSFPYEPKYIQLKADIQYEHGYSDTDEPEEGVSGVIPTHSHLTMAWVESGILGGACWIYIFGLTLRAALRLSTLRPNLAPLYGYFLASFLWDILYSPFGSVNRIWGAFFILLSYHIVETSAAKDQAARYERVKHIFGRKKLRLPRIAVS